MTPNPGTPEPQAAPEPLTAEEIAALLTEAGRDYLIHARDGAEVQKHIARYLTDALNDRLAAAPMRDVDVVEKRPVDAYVGLATEIAAAYLRALGTSIADLENALAVVTPISQEPDHD